VVPFPVTVLLQFQGPEPEGQVVPQLNLCSGAISGDAHPSAAVSNLTGQVQLTTTVVVYMFMLQVEL